MSAPTEEERAAQYLRDQQAILARRNAMARSLLAPPSPRAAVVAAWAPMRSWIAERRTVGGDKGALGG